MMVLVQFFSWPFPAFCMPGNAHVSKKQRFCNGEDHFAGFTTKGLSCPSLEIIQDPPPVDHLSESKVQSHLGKIIKGVTDPEEAQENVDSQTIIMSDQNNYARILQDCSSKKLLSEGKRIHAFISKDGLQDDMFLGNLLVDMYRKCDALLDARQVFNTMPNRGVVSWTSMIAALIQHDQCQEAIKLFRQMVAAGEVPNKFTFSTIINALENYSDLGVGKLIHGHILLRRYQTDVIVGTALLNMYAKCGHLEAAQSIFRKIQDKNVVSWSTMISACAKLGQAHESLRLFREMKQEGIMPNKFCFVNVLDACTSLGEFSEGKMVHSHIIDSGFEDDAFVGTALVNMYGKCGRVQEALGAFDKVRKKNVLSWNAMIAAYSQNGQDRESLRILLQTQSIGIVPDKVTFINILDARADSTLAVTKIVHAFAACTGFDLDVVVGTALINMYSRYRSLESIKTTFGLLYQGDIVLWTVMISAYAHHGFSKQAFLLFQQMQEQGIFPNKITFVSILDACQYPSTLIVGMLMHAWIINFGYETDLVVGTALVDMYGRYKRLEDAQRVFDKINQKDVILWTALLAAYSQHGCIKEALKLLRDMHTNEIMPNRITFVAILDACAKLGDPDIAQTIHDRIVDVGLHSDVTIVTGLINMYAKCRRLEDAQKLFNKMHEKNSISWTVMVAAYAHNGHRKEAFKLYQQMQHKGVDLDKIAFISILDACAIPAAFAEGVLLHAHVIDNGLESDVDVGNSLINMYIKCASLHNACRMFDKMRERDLISWNTILAAYVQHGHSQVALNLFKQMQREGQSADKITLISLLAGFNIVGSMVEGCQYFMSIGIEYGTSSTVEHFGCLINLLCRASLLNVAEDLMNQMPFLPDIVLWLTLLDACKRLHNIDIGRRVAQFVVKLDPLNVTARAVLLNNFAGTHKRKDIGEEDNKYSNTMAFLYTAFCVLYFGKIRTQRCKQTILSSPSFRPLGRYKCNNPTPTS